MEAASARYAARDRFGALGEPAQSQLQQYIQNAVDPHHNYEPNLALNLEISDLINAKKGNAPREAAVAIVNFVNHRNPSVALLSLALLDICVKNCGYPFHLQISTKEFLNELVRRFPERPPMRPTRVQMKILELIEEWRSTICETSRYKEDLGYIRDMHRLLHVKGYVFPETRREDAAVLNRSENLQSADEMEEEERAAQSAKLQELIRRGRPRDLQEANRLMKVMAGYDTRHKTDYRAKAAEEVGKVQAKAKLLEERLQNFTPGEKIGDGDVFDELAGALQSAHPKIQKMCEEESDDAEAIAKLLEINDSIHRTIERYKLVKKGDLEAAAQIPKGTLGTSTGVSKTANNELSLIDFDPEASADTAPETEDTKAENSGSIENDLLSLSVQDHTYGQTGFIALGALSNNAPPANVQQSMPVSLPPQQQGPPPQTPPSAPKPNYDAFSAFASNPPGASQGSPSTPKSAPPKTIPSAVPTDPFAAFSSPTQQPPQSGAASHPTQGSSSGLLDLQSNIPSAAPPSPSTEVTNGNKADDDWNFASALPEETQLPSRNTIIVSNTSVRIAFEVSRSTESPDTIDIKALFSNNTASPITEFTFQVAVTKGFALKLTPQSGRLLNPNQQNGISQPVSIAGVAQGQVNAMKMRWKASYKMVGALRQDQGEVPPLGVA